MPKAKVISTSRSIKMPPQNTEAEASVLGGILIDSEAIVKVAEVLKPEDFYRNDYRVVYEAALRLFEGRRPVDILTMLEELEKTGQLEEAGGAGTVSSLAAAVATATNIKHYAEIVKEKAILRRIISAGTAIADLGYNEAEDISTVIDTAEQKLFEVSSRFLKTNFLPITDILTESYERIEKMHREGNAIRGTPTGFLDLDEKLSGLQPSNLIILAARPSVGKCVTGETKIFNPATGDLEAIKTICRRKSGQVATLDKNGRFKPASPSNFVADGIKKTFLVKTALGREIEATAVHPLLTQDGWKKLLELKPGDRIAVPKLLPFFGKEELPDQQITALAYSVASRAWFKKPIVASMALQAATGTVLAGTAPVFRESGLFTGLKPAGALLVKHDLEFKNSSRCRLPKLVFRLKKKNLALFLDRLFVYGEGASGLNPSRCSQISFDSFSKSLAKEVQHLLTRFGVLAKLKESLIQLGGKKRRMFEVVVADRENVLRFRDRIGGKRLRDDSKKEKVQSEIYFDQIVSIVPTGSKPVYDLTVNETSNFVANDVVVHNTSLALNIAENAAIEHKVPVAIFSLEMSREELVDRMLCSQAGIDLWKLRTGKLSDEDFAKISYAMGALSEAPLYIDDSPMSTAMEIRAKARRLSMELNRPLGLIVIDYLQLLHSGRGGRGEENRVQEVSEISRGLKALARDLEAPVLALSQLSRAVESRNDRRPQLSDLRESGSLEQDSDVVMFIYRDEYYDQETENKNIAEVLVRKHRNGPTGDCKLFFKNEYMKFSPIEKNMIEPPK